MKIEATIVGGGPAGLLTAIEIASKGFNTVIFEEHPNIGAPNHCAGLLSLKGLDRLGIDVNPVYRQNTVCGGRIYSPDGEYLEIRDEKPRACVVDREAFDRFLADKAEHEGVIIEKNSHVKEIINGKLRVKESLIEPEIVINAEGTGGRLLRRSGFDYRSPELINGFNAELSGVELDPNLVELWFSEDLAPKFFAWVIPVNESRARVGLGSSSDDGLNLLRGFVKKRFNTPLPSRLQAGKICVGGPTDRTLYGNVLLVGDVAGQVKATTGGGVVTGGLCAKLAGEVASNYLEGNGSLQAYETLWRKKYGFELKTMHSVRRLLNNIDDERFNRVLHFAKKEKIEGKLQELLETGDIDMQSSVIKKVLFDPVIFPALLKVLGKFAFTELFSLFT